VQASEPMPRRLQLNLLDPGDCISSRGASGGDGPAPAQFRARSSRRFYALASDSLQRTPHLQRAVPPLRDIALAAAD
jgi:hypothetical protein